MGDYSLFDMACQCLMVGFQGTHEKDPQVQEVLSLAKNGHIGGVIFFRHNFTDVQQARDLVHLFKEIQDPHPLLLAVDQEGGTLDRGAKGVQRLWSGNGFGDYPSAYHMATHESPERAQEIYLAMAKEVKQVGLNTVFGPMVDLHHPNSPIIGGIHRAYGRDRETITTYAQAFTRAFQSQGIFTCLKHFPGHGLAKKDSHLGMVDITETHHPDELEIFHDLVAQGQNHMIMTAHVHHRDWDPHFPASLSPTIQKEYMPQSPTLVRVTDDLCMGALKSHGSLGALCARALQAGSDLLIASGNPLAWGATTQDNGSFYPGLLEAFKKNMIELDVDFLRIQNAHQRLGYLRRKLTAD